MTTEPTAKAMMTAVRNSADLRASIQADPIIGLEMAEEQARLYSKEGDQFLFRVVVIVLGATLLITLVGVLALAMLNVSIPAEIIALGSAALGALAGLLAPSPVRSGG